MSPFEGLEPGAADVAHRIDRLASERTLAGDVSEAELVLPTFFSIAISLKRIADALTGEGPSIMTAPINSYGEGIGDAIQGQMIRGQRGIDQYEGR